MRNEDWENNFEKLLLQLYRLLPANFSSELSFKKISSSFVNFTT